MQPRAPPPGAAVLLSGGLPALPSSWQAGRQARPPFLVEPSPCARLLMRASLAPHTATAAPFPHPLPRPPSLMQHEWPGCVMSWRPFCVYPPLPYPTSLSPSALLLPACLTGSPDCPACYVGVCGPSPPHCSTARQPHLTPGTVFYCCSVHPLHPPQRNAHQHTSKQPTALHPFHAPSFPSPHCTHACMQTHMMPFATPYLPANFRAAGG